MIVRLLDVYIFIFVNFMSIFWINDDTKCDNTKIMKIYSASAIPIANYIYFIVIQYFYFHDKQYSTHNIGCKKVTISVITLKSLKIIDIFIQSS